MSTIEQFVEHIRQASSRENERVGMKRTNKWKLGAAVGFFVVAIVFAFIGFFATDVKALEYPWFVALGSLVLGEACLFWSADN